MREKARTEGRSKLYDGRWRDRDPAEAPAGVKPVIRLKAALTGETAIEDEVQGRVVWQERASRRSRPAALGRHAHLYAVGRGRRPRYGRYPHHPRRRPPHQCRPADSNLQCAGLVGLGDGAHPADPWARRLEALQAPRRARGRRLPCLGLPPGGAAQLPRPAPAGAMATKEIFSTDEMVRTAFDLAAYRAVGGAVRFRQARESPQRALHPPIKRCRACRCHRAAVAASRQRCRTRATAEDLTPEFKAQLQLTGDARPKRAGEEPGPNFLRAPGFSTLIARSPWMTRRRRCSVATPARSSPS